MIRKTISGLASAVLLFGLLGFAPAPERAATAAAPPLGETDLFNFEHVGNLNFSYVLNAGSEEQQGTDMEFFTAPVVVRDADGNRIGADGEILDDSAPDHIAERDFAVVGDHSSGIVVIDITSPEDAYVATFIECNNPRSDIGVFQWTEEDGTLRTFVGSSRESGAICSPKDGSGTPQAMPQTTSDSDDGNPLTNENGGFAMFEVTDPYNAEPFAAVRIGAGGAHNFMFHPTEPIAYAWNGELGTAEVTSIQIVDLSPYFVDGEDVTAIRSFVGPTTLGSPHDGELSPDGSIMYVASENNYEIFDNSDPLNPVVTTAFAPNPGTYAHGYFPTPDGNIAVTNNESLALGGFFADRTGICPGEGLAFYDTSVEGAAVGPLSYFVPPVQGQTPDHRACTSHFGRVADNNQVMTVGWYILGGRVVDFSVPTLPVEIGAATISLEDSKSGSLAVNGGKTAGTEAWSAKFYKGPYMYVGDQGRGFDVFRWTGPEDCGNPFDETWVGVDNCEGLEYRMQVDPTESPQRTVLTPALAAQALATTNEDSFSWRFSCQL